MREAAMPPTAPAVYTKFNNQNSFYTVKLLAIVSSNKQIQEVY